MNNNVSVRLVFDRKHVATKKHQASVQIEIMYQRKRKYIGTGIKLYADQWGKDSRVKNHPQALLFNQQLSDKISGIYDFAHTLARKGMEFSFDKLEEYLQDYFNDQSELFLDFMERRIEARGVSEATKARQRCVLKALKQFGKIRTFSDVTSRNISLWDRFAKTKCSKQSAVYNYHKILKVFVREAFAESLIPTNPYQNLRLDRGKTNVRKYLTKEELAAIEDKDIENESLARVRDMFLFCCYTGLAYSDLAKFNFSDATYSDGLYRIRDCRKKTGTEYNISLIDKAMAILRRYSFSLPIISNQKYNTYLKVLGAFCEVKKPLTSHVARHTFATTVAMANGVRIEVISKMLGHTNIQTTQLYAKIYQQEVDNEFNRLNEVI